MQITSKLDDEFFQPGYDNAVSLDPWTHILCKKNREGLLSSGSNCVWLA